MRIGLLARNTDTFCSYDSLAWTGWQCHWHYAQYDDADLRWCLLDTHNPITTGQDTTGQETLRNLSTYQEIIRVGIQGQWATRVGHATNYFRHGIISTQGRCQSTDSWCGEKYVGPTNIWHRNTARKYNYIFISFGGRVYKFNWWLITNAKSCYNKHMGIDDK